jgi:hypothetical protein
MAQEPPNLPPAGGTPWERRDEIGFVSALIETTKEVLTAPTAFFRAMPVTGGIGSPLLYAVVVGWLGILVSAVYGGVFLVVGGAARSSAFGPLADRPELARFMEMFSTWIGLVIQVVFGPVFIVIGVFVGAAITHLFLLLLGGADQGFEATFRVMAYAHAARILTIVPLCGGVIALVWSLVIHIIGLAEAQRIPAWKAAIAVLLPGVLVCCCCVGGLGLMFGGLAGILSQAHAR